MSAPAERIVWVNGELRPESNAGISPFDHGLLTGDGVFETLTTYGGVPFGWTRHVDRLRRSAEALGLPMPDAAALRQAVTATMEANGLPDARVRITLTGGPAPLGSARGDVEPTVLVVVTAPHTFDPTVDVVTVPWPRNQRGALAGLKTISYAENVRALAYAQERSAGEAIFTDLDGHLCEGTGTNVFFVSGGRLCTPALSTGCLDGVTRQIVVEVICPQIGIECAEVVVPAAALAAAEEAFVTSSTREAQPVATVDGTVLPAAPGPITTAVIEAFPKVVADDLDP